MRRRLLVTATLVLCVAQVVVISLWAASLFRYDFLTYVSPGRRAAVGAISSDGGLGAYVAFWGAGRGVDTRTGWRWSSLPHLGRGGLGLDPLHGAPNLLGIGGRYDAFNERGGRVRRVIVVTPYWFLLLCLALPTLLVARGTLRRRIFVGRRAAGRCAACGYDLRGSLGAADACPECGESPSGGEGGGGHVSSARPTATAGSTPAATAASAR